MVESKMSCEFKRKAMYIFNYKNPKKYNYFGKLLRIKQMKTEIELPLLNILV